MGTLARQKAKNHARERRRKERGGLARALGLQRGWGGVGGNEKGERIGSKKRQGLWGSLISEGGMANTQKR